MVGPEFDRRVLQVTGFEKLGFGPVVIFVKQIVVPEVKTQVSGDRIRARAVVLQILAGGFKVPHAQVDVGQFGPAEFFFRREIDHFLVPLQCLREFLLLDVAVADHVVHVEQLQFRQRIIFHRDLKQRDRFAVFSLLVQFDSLVL